MSQQKVKFAIVGYGHIGKRHAEMIRRNDEAELVAVVDSMSQAECGADGIEESFFATMEEMFEAHPEIDVVNICTPNGLHASQALKALNQKKHVVCEKPMGLSKSQLRRGDLQSSSSKQTRFLRNAKPLFTAFRMA